MTDTPIAPLRLTLADGAVFTFAQGFTIGRHSECPVRVQDGMVSRRHAEIFPENGQWWIQDLQSANGVFVDDQRVERAVLSGTGSIHLGAKGPTLFFEVETPPTAPPAPPPPQELSVSSTPATDLDHYKEHYFGKTLDQPMGDHTMMIRRAFAEVQKKQRTMYGVIIGLVTVLLFITGSVAWYKHRQVTEQRRLAADVFYTMRELEIDLIQLRVEAARQKSLAVQKQLDVVKARKKKLEQSYDRYVDSLDIYSKGLNAKEKLILRMAHRFGECEINMPPGFVKTVTGFIENWQASQRLSRVIRRAQRKGYIPRIVKSLTAADLPPQFLYLAVQESNLDSRAVGPSTRFGIAKGMWQFIPKTAEKYGLRVGPLKDQAVVDLLDERHDFLKSTRAAADYLRDIYTTDAQASGMLVMASYNWGEERVINLIQTLPKNPRQRNFWALITTCRDKVPDETYDYVFSIFTAAVIGENPKLFGFDFDNPLVPADGN